MQKPQDPLELDLDRLDRWTRHEWRNAAARAIGMRLSDMGLQNLVSAGFDDFKRIAHAHLEAQEFLAEDYRAMYRVLERMAKARGIAPLVM